MTDADTLFVRFHAKYGGTARRSPVITRINNI